MIAFIDFAAGVTKIALVTTVHSKFFKPCIVRKQKMFNGLICAMSNETLTEVARLKKLVVTFSDSYVTMCYLQLKLNKRITLDDYGAFRKSIKL